jgi:hypothetical protein
MLLQKQLLLQLDMVMDPGAPGASPSGEELRKKNLELSRHILEGKHTISCLRAEVECLTKEKRALKEKIELQADEVQSCCSLLSPSFYLFLTFQGEKVN